MAVVLSELERRSVEVRIEKEHQRSTWQAAMDRARNRAIQVHRAAVLGSAGATVTALTA